MLPQMPQTVTVRTPGSPGVDPVTGNAVPAALTESRTKAYLSQQPVTILSANPELHAYQDTTISTYTMLLPSTVEITSDSTVVDEQDVVYQVVGHPASRGPLDRKIKFTAVSLRRISDLQT